MKFRQSPEFKAIERYFDWGEGHGLAVGVGDDCAILELSAGRRLCFSMDTLVEGVHFPSDTAANVVAARALGTALSDLAAMGASPLNFTLSLTLPQLDESWLEAFASALKEVANRYNVALAGGDTTRGPLAVCIQVHGWLPLDQALLRSGAKVGDRLFVSGYLGDAAGGLACIQKRAPWDEYLVNRFEAPAPRIALGEYLRPFATSAIDISDGLVADLGHIARASRCLIELDALKVPLSDPLTRACPRDALALALSGGDDYEIAFTVPQVADEGLLNGLRNFACTEIGRVSEGEGVSVLNVDERASVSGYDHFAGGEG